MRTPRPRSLSARSAGIGMAGLLVAGLAAVAGPTLASAQTGSGEHMSGEHMSSMDMSEHASPSVVDHRHRLDLARVFGSTPESALLPPHGVTHATGTNPVLFFAVQEK